MSTTQSNSVSTITRDSGDSISATSQLKRFVFAGLGICFVAIGAIGVFVPGLPTTIFLIVASWCFAKSCPWLEEKLIRNKLFRPYLKFLDGEPEMSRAAKAVAMLMMWTAVTVSCTALIVAGAVMWITFIIIAAALVGTWFIARGGFRRTRKPATAARESTEEANDAVQQFEVREEGGMRQTVPTT